jgi:hypothetical protein
MAGLALLALFDTRKKLTVMTFVPIPATVESSPMLLLPEVVVDQGRTESLPIWKKTSLSGILTCGPSDILGDSSCFPLVRLIQLKLW